MFPFFFDPTFVLIIPVLILSFYAQSKIKSNYKKFHKVLSSSGLSGAEVARKILDRNGLSDIQIRMSDGQLTDAYDPRDKTVNLSRDVYEGRSISALSIASHEVGHALQDAEKYTPLLLRANILPVANLGSKFAFPLFIIGMIFSFSALMDIGIILFAGALIFHLVTLPVEFNASNRAIAQLKSGFIYDETEIKGCKKVLNAAALTYVAATLMALVNLIRLLVLRGSRD